jgi:hypothetical protein
MCQGNVKVNLKMDASEGIKGNKIPNLKHQIIGAWIFNDFSSIR